MDSWERLAMRVRDLKLQMHEQIMLDLKDDEDAYYDERAEVWRDAKDMDPYDEWS